MPSCKVYLSGPIDLVPKFDAKDWRREARNLLAKHQIDVIDPTDYFTDWKVDPADRAVAEVIVTFDQAKLVESDLMLVNAATPGWGTAMELYIFTQVLKKPAVAFLPTDTKRSTWLVHHATVVTCNLESAVGWLKDWSSLL